MVADQRARLRTAMVEVVAGRGLDGVTVRGLSRTAGVSTRTFYAHFPNAEECFTSTYESVMQTALKRFTAAGVQNGEWEATIREGIQSLLDEIAENPSAGQLALVESFSAGPAMVREMGHAVHGFEQFVADTFNAAPGRVAVPLPIVQGLAAGAERVVRVRILEGRNAELPDLAEELADWALSMHDQAVARLPIPVRSECAGRKQADRRVGGRELDAGEFGAIGDERGRILGAAAKLGARDGYWNLTIPKVRREAGVSRRAFDAQFDGVAECYLEAIETLTVAAAARAQRRAVGCRGWEQGVCRIVTAFCAEVARSSTLSRLAFIDVFAPGREGLACRERLIEHCSGQLKEVASPQRLSELATEASVAAAWRIIQAEIVAGRARKLPQVAPFIAFAILAPAIGAARAAKAICAEQINDRIPNFLDERGLTQVVR